jgi:hypothetical protein
MPGLRDYDRDGPNLRFVESAFDIDIRRWQRRGLLVPATRFRCLWVTNRPKTASLEVEVRSVEELRLVYRIRMPRKRWQRLEQTVSVAWDACRYGGRRPWLVCPKCSCRVAILYLGGASYLAFWCRVCAQLKYESQRRGPRLKAMLKAQKIRRQLGGSGSLEESFPPKPVFMHWRKYLRIQEMGMNAEKDWSERSEYLFRPIKSEAASVSAPSVETSDEAPPRSEGDAQVSFFITKAQKAQLRERGHSDEEIAKMRPAEAHRILGLG